MTMPGTFAAVFAALYVGHMLADHWVQTPAQAARKSLRGRPGRLACARHVATLTLTLAGVLAAVALVTGMRLTMAAVTAGLIVNAVSHWWADRRFTLQRFAALLGKAEFWFLGAPRPGRDDNPTLGTGSYALDQGWHLAWLLITALIITGGSR